MKTVHCVSKNIPNIFLTHDLLGRFSPGSTIAEVG